MMTIRQFLLLKLAEECDEVSQRALKQIQFGRDEIQSGQASTNGQRLYQELADLMAVIDMLSRMGEIPEEDISTYIDDIVEKQAKIIKYMEYSQSLGTVEMGVYNDR